MALVPGMYDGYGVNAGGLGEIALSDGSANAEWYKYQAKHEVRCADGFRSFYNL